MKEDDVKKSIAFHELGASMGFLVPLSPVAGFAVYFR
jgi:hypothetical protein